MNGANKRGLLDWLALILTPLAVVLMEVFWGYPWLLWAGKWETLHLGKPPLGIISVLALVALSFLATRFLLSRSWSSSAIKRTVLGLGLLVVFIIIRIEYGNGIELFSTRWFIYMGQTFTGMFDNLSGIVMALLVAAYFWWRGMLLGRAREYLYVHNNVLFGAGSFAVLTLVAWATLGTDMLGKVSGLLAANCAGFFFCGLVAMAMGNLRSIQKRMHVEETRTVSFRRWVPIILGIVSAIVLVSILIATISSLDIAGFVKMIFGAIFKFLGMVINYLVIAFQYILLPFEWIASFVVLFIMYLGRLFGNKAPEQTGDQTGGVPPELPETVKQGSPEVLTTVLKWVLLAIAVIAITVIIIRSIDKTRRHRKPEEKPDYEEIHESLWSWQKLFSDLIIFFEHIFSYLLPWRKPKKILPQSQSSPAQTEESRTTLKIRDVFKHLLRDASRAGIVWRHSETPYEYAQRFEKIVPEAGVQMSELTELYVTVRYSTSGGDERQVVQANDLWRRIRELLKQLKSGDKK